MELRGLTLGIVGFGRIGRCVGRLARAFGMDVAAHTRTMPSDDNDVITPEYKHFEWRCLEDIFAESDIVSLHCPQTEKTTGMVNAELLSLMDKHAYFINTARGGLVVEQDLADALNSDKLAGATVDVVSKEPISPDNPLLTAKNITITPHIAWASLAARKRLMTNTAENIAAFLVGEKLNLVN